MKFTKYVPILKEKLYNSIGFPFSDVINDDIIQQAFNDEQVKYRQRLYTPIIILWTWIYQCLSEKNTCKNAVSKIISLIAQSGAQSGETPSPNTGAYCRARKRIKEGVFLRLLKHTGKHLHNLDDMTWCGRRVVLADGSTITMDDTEDNQKEYPQPQSQKEGCGFPMANIVVLFCLKTGAVLEAMIGSQSIGELNLFRKLYEYIQPGDIALADRLYSSYADICLLKAGSVDGVFRLHARRKTDFRKGKILGVKDHIVTWSKPRCCPSGLEKSLFDKLPQSIQLREIQFCVGIKGFRTQRITIVTTLLDAKLYTKESLAELYCMRWNVEIDLRYLKTTMQMEHISCKTPEMVRKSFYVYLLSYNLVRMLMYQSSEGHDVTPLELSFSSSIVHLLNFGSLLAHSDIYERQRLYKELLYVVSKERIPIRKGRVEPRLIKRRPKNYGWLKQPRKQLKKQLVA